MKKSMSDAKRVQISDCLECLTAPASHDYKRGMIVGLVSGLMASNGRQWSKAVADIAYVISVHEKSVAYESAWKYYAPESWVGMTG